MPSDPDCFNSLQDAFFVTSKLDFPDRWYILYGTKTRAVFNGVTKTSIILQRLSDLTVFEETLVDN